MNNIAFEAFKDSTSYQLFTKITFRVRAKTTPGEHVHVIGDSDHLGNWIPSQAPRLSTTALTFPLWEGTVSLPRGETYRYKYVIINQKTQLIKWESKKKDFRTVTTTGLEMIVNDGEFGTSSTADHTDPIADNEVWVDEGWLASEYQLRLTLGFNDPAGNYQWPVVLHNLTTSLSSVFVELQDGLFTRETIEVPLPPQNVEFGTSDTIHYVYFTSYNTQKSHRHQLNKTHTESHSTSHNEFNIEKYEKLNEENYKRIQNEDFYFHTTDFNQLKVTVDIFTHSQSELKDYQFKDQSISKIGRAVITGAQLKPNRGALTVPILNSALEYIGDFTFRFLVVTPFRHPYNNLSTLWTHYSLGTKPVNLNIGHRGSGATSRTIISENTILSFMTAAQFGADFVEFDVQLTKDKVPVLFHDIEICVREDLNGNPIYVPIGHLTYEQFMALKHPEVENLVASRIERILGTTPYKPHGRKKIIRRSVSLQNSSSEHPEQTETESTERKIFILSDRFTTLEEALRVLPTELGFVVEIKYPADWAKRAYNIVYHERNPLVDKILDIIFNSLDQTEVHSQRTLNGTQTTATSSPVQTSATSSTSNRFRRILFASFDADVCYLLSLKQPLYPVFFLLGIGFDFTYDMDIDKYDIRCTDWDTAINFAKSARLRGIISYTKPILENPQLIEKIHQNKLLLFTYGRHNEDENAREFQKKHGVDSLIVDNIIHIKKNSTKFKKLMTALAPSPLLPNQNDTTSNKTKLEK